MDKGPRDLLRRAVSGGRAVHAYLLAGSDPEAGRSTALYLAQALVCEQRPDGPCGVCLGCRKAAEGNHPDVHWIAPDGASLKLQQVHALQNQAWLRPTEAPGKVFILEQAEAMTLEAANSLLRILEDPPGSATFVLLTAQPQQMLPTILSRCQRLDLPAGEPLMSSERRREARDLIAALPAMDELQILDLAESWDKERETLVPRVRALSACYRDLLVLDQTNDPSLLSHPDDLEWLRIQAAERSAPGLIASAEACEDCLRHLERNANPRLAAEVLLFRLRAA
ncbi:MAG: ATP-binding protein [Bacillota bacterium]